MKKKIHNGNISVWKFVFALLILCHHCCYIKPNRMGKLFNAGSIGVEFFFLVSGYLLAKKVYSEEKKKTKKELYQSTFEFIMNKIKVFYPYLLFSFVCFTIVELFLHHMSIGRYIMGFVDLILIQEAGLPDKGIVGGSWYLSALILSMAIIYPLMKKYKKTFSCLIAPLLAIFLGGFLIHQINPKYSLRTYNAWTGVMYMGMGRALFEVSLGTTLYEICEKFKKIKFTKLGSIFLTIFQFSCFSFVILANTFLTTRKLDWLYIILLIVGVLIGFSEKTYFYEKCNNKVFYYLEKLSLPIYLNNFLFIYVINYTRLSTMLSFPIKFIAVVLVTPLFSAVELWLVKYLCNIFSKLREKVTTVLIES